MDRTISSSKADTSGIRWSMSVGESLAVSFFSPKGVLKERSKTERVMKISIAPFFGLKQTNKQSTILVRQTHQTQFLLLGNGILEWWAHLQQFDLQTNAMATGSLGASPDSHAPWEQPCRLYRLWLEITLSCWRAKVSATMRVTHKMNACHQPPIVKTKKNKNQTQTICVFHPVCLMAKQTVGPTLVKMLEGRRAVSPISSHHCLHPLPKKRYHTKGVLRAAQQAVSPRQAHFWRH